MYTPLPTLLRARTCAAQVFSSSRVNPPRASLTPMHADVGECRRGDPVGIEAAADRDAERYLVCCQQLVDLARMPAGMAELDHPALAGREQGEKVRETGEVELLGGRKLEQDRAQLGAQMASALHEQRRSRRRRSGAA